MQMTIDDKLVWTMNQENMTDNLKIVLVKQ